MHTIFNIISVHLPESSLLRFFKNASGRVTAAVYDTVYVMDTAKAEIIG